MASSFWMPSHQIPEAEGQDQPTLNPKRDSKSANGLRRNALFNVLDLSMSSDSSETPSPIRIFSWNRMASPSLHLCALKQAPLRILLPLTMQIRIFHKPSAVCPFGKNLAYLLGALRGAQHTSHSSLSFERTVIGKSLFHSR